MDNDINQNTKKIPTISIASLFLGIGSLVVLLVSIGLVFLVEALGITSFFSLVSVLGIAAIVCGILGGKKSTNENLPGKNMAITGFIFGVFTLVITFAARILIFLFFIPGLGA